MAYHARVWIHFQSSLKCKILFVTTAAHMFIDKNQIEIQRSFGVFPRVSFCSESTFHLIERKWFVDTDQCLAKKTYSWIWRLEAPVLTDRYRSALSEACRMSSSRDSIYDIRAYATSVRLEPEAQPLSPGGKCRNEKKKKQDAKDSHTPRVNFHSMFYWLSRVFRGTFGGVGQWERTRSIVPFLVCSVFRQGPRSDAANK